MAGSRIVCTVSMTAHREFTRLFSTVGLSPFELCSYSDRYYCSIYFIFVCLHFTFPKKEHFAISLIISIYTITVLQNKLYILLKEGCYTRNFNHYSSFWDTLYLQRLQFQIILAWCQYEWSRRWVTCRKGKHSLQQKNIPTSNFTLNKTFLFTNFVVLVFCCLAQKVHQWSNEQTIQKVWWNNTTV